MKRVLEKASLFIIGTGNMAKGLSATGAQGMTTGLYQLIPSGELMGSHPLAYDAVHFITAMKEAKPVNNGTTPL